MKLERYQPEPCSVVAYTAFSYRIVCIVTQKNKL